MKVYIAGKIKDEPKYRFFYFKANILLQNEGHYVLDPSDLPEGMSPADYMHICLPMLLAADAIALLPNWQESEGAKIEKALAEYCGKQVIPLSWSEIIHARKFIPGEDS